MPDSQRTATRLIGGVAQEYETAHRERERERERGGRKEKSEWESKSEREREREREGGEKGEVRVRERREVASLSLGWAQWTVHCRNYTAGQLLEWHTEMAANIIEMGTGLHRGSALNWYRYKIKWHVYVKYRYALIILLITFCSFTIKIYKNRTQKLSQKLEPVGVNLTFLINLNRITEEVVFLFFIHFLYFLF